MNARRTIYLFLTGVATATPVGEIQPAAMPVALLSGIAYLGGVRDQDKTISQMVHSSSKV